MKKILRFLFIAAAMLAYYFAYSFLISPIVEQFVLEGVGVVNESAMFIWNLIVSAVSAVIFVVLYTKWYIATSEHKRDFLKRMESAEYKARDDIFYYMEEYNGNIDILIYMVYSVLFPVSILLFNGKSPISFLYFHQFIFYTFGFTRSIVFNVVFGYTACILFFIAGYISGVLILHKRWYKKRLRK